MLAYYSKTIGFPISKPSTNCVLMKCTNRLQPTYHNATSDTEIFEATMENSLSIKWRTVTTTIVRLEVFMAVKIQTEIFWVVMPCSVVVGYQHFRGPCCLHLHNEVTGNSETKGHRYRLVVLPAPSPVTLL
jgi:hypothetical protein